MPSEERVQELIKGLYDSIVNMDDTTAVKLSNAIVDEGIDAYQAVTEGLSAAMSKVGELYVKQEYFVPELLLCSDALYASLEILKPHIKTEQFEVKGQLVIGVVEGDIHDIGKNLVKLMFEAAGWTVYDLGVDVRLDRFVQEQQRTGSNLVAVSALMTTSMQAIPKLVKMIKAQNPEVSILVGGAPLTLDIAKSYGADGYADTAVKAVAEAEKLVKAFSTG